jgi:hypothetical protein
MATGGVDRSVVLRGRATGIVVEHVEAAELVDGGADRYLQAVGVGHVGADRNHLVTGLTVNVPCIMLGCSTCFGSPETP